MKMLKIFIFSLFWRKTFITQTIQFIILYYWCFLSTIRWFKLNAASCNKKIFFILKNSYYKQAHNYLFCIDLLNSIRIQIKRKLIWNIRSYVTSNSNNSKRLSISERKFLQENRGCSNQHPCLLLSVFTFFVGVICNSGGHVCDLFLCFVFPFRLFFCASTFFKVSFIETALFVGVNNETVRTRNIIHHQRIERFPIHAFVILRPNHFFASFNKNFDVEGLIN